MYVLCFLSIILIIHLITKKPIQEIARVVIRFGFLFIIPGFVDLIIYGKEGFPINYFIGIEDSINALLFTFVPFKEIQGASCGIRVEVFLICLGSGLYVGKMTKNLIKGILTFVIIFLFIYLIGSMFVGVELFGKLWHYFYLDSNYFQGTWKNWLLGYGVIVSSYTQKTNLIFMTLLIIVSLIFYYRYRADYFKCIIKKF